MRYLFAAVFSLSILFPSIAFGVDMRCFTETECIKKREMFMSPADAKVNPLYQGTDAQKACGGKENKEKEKIGFCYPASNASTRISFAGQRNFSGMGEFIQFGYRFAVVVASLLAVIMIIIAGFQWTASGGSADAIKSAQKKIAGAIMGLVLAVLSFFILNTINPYLVNLRLPQAWMINTTVFPTELCKDLSNITTESFAAVPSTDGKLDTDAYNSATFNIKYNEADKDALKKNFSCGTPLFYKSGRGDVCRGHLCVPGGGATKTCAKDLEKNTYGCFSGDFYGTIKNTQWDIPFLKELEGGVDVVDDLDVYVVCENGSKVELSHNETFPYVKEDKLIKYSVVVTDASTSADAKKKCPDEKALGLILYPDFDKNLSIFDEAHYIGVKPTKKNIAVDLGDANTTYFQAIAKNEKFAGVDPKSILIDLKALDDGYELNIDAGEIKIID